MRRFPIAVVLSAVTALAPLSTPVGAEAVHASATTARIAVPSPRALAAAAARLQRDQIAAATQRELAGAARTMHLTVGQLRAQWQHVAICEVGGNWSMTGPIYSGIGFLNATWSAYGGQRYAPLAGRASRDQQIVVGLRVTGGWVPDQHGCSPTGW